MGAGGHARVERDPTGVASHHLDDEHPAVRRRGGEQPVDALGRDLDGGVEAERRVGLVEVVVDRLRHADHPHPGVGQPPRDRQRAVAADRDQRLDAGVAEQADELVGAVDGDPRAVVLLHREGGRVAPVRAAQDRAAEVADAAHQVAGQLDRSARRVQLGEHQPVEAVADADGLPTSAGGGQRRRPDDGVEPGASPPPVEMAILTAPHYQNRTRPMAEVPIEGEVEASCSV